MNFQEYTLVCLFSGQGSHYRGMGRMLFETEPTFRASMLNSEAIIQQTLGRSIINELYHTPVNKPFNDLLVTHPSIVAVELGLLTLLKHWEIEPNFYCGSSLGEFAAAVGAGIWSEETALETAVAQAKSIVRYSIEGGMISVYDQSYTDWESVARSNDLFLVSENCAQHFTVSGRHEALDSFQVLLKERKAGFQRLQVPYAFHSPLINTSQSDFLYYLNSLSWNNPFCDKFISGLHHKSIQHLHPNYFWEVVVKPFNYLELSSFLESQGPCLYLDLSPSGTSVNFIKRNSDKNSQSKILPLMTPFKTHLNNLRKLKQIPAA